MCIVFLATIILADAGSLTAAASSNQPAAERRRVVGYRPVSRRTGEAQQRAGGLGRYFGGVSLAGATACSLTHSIVIPLDVIKTRMQTDAHAAAGGSLAAAGAVLRDAPGRGLLRFAAFFNGLPPTALGYFLQGATKFGGYEVFKQNAYARLRAHGGEEAYRKWQLPVMLASAATAEMMATVLLAPLEVLKLRVQTDAAAASRGVICRGCSRSSVKSPPLMRCTKSSL